MINPLEVWEKLGIKDYKTNEDYFIKLTKQPFVTEEDIAILDPDETDNETFWAHAPNLDSCSIASMGKTAYDAYEINQTNQILIKQGCDLDSLRLSPNSVVIEIGAGYGSLYSLLPHYVTYFGLDICPRFNKVIKSIDRIPEELVEGWKNKISHVVSFNCLQHLSNKVKKQYIKDSFKILKPQGRFVLNLSVDSPNPLKDKDGRSYYYTAGQLVKSCSMEEINKMISDSASEEKVKLIKYGFNTGPYNVITYNFVVEKEWQT